jgi:hypothetical protein
MMTRTIYKFVIFRYDGQLYECEEQPYVVEVMLPISRRILKFDFDGTGDLCIWVEYDPEAERTAEKFTIYGTGWDINKDATYVGTAISGSGYVWHCYML